MKHVGLVGIALIFTNCSEKASLSETKTDITEPFRVETIAIPDTGFEKEDKPTGKYDFQPGPDSDLEYFDEHFDDYYFDDPEDLSVYPDESFDFNLD